MPTPGEHKTVQACILGYAQEVGWTYVPRGEAETRRGLDHDKATAAKPAERATLYLTCIRRGRSPSRWEGYPMGLRTPLPTIPIPLRENEADLLVSLQPTLDRVYIAGGHDDIDYSKPAKPPLRGDDAAWADRLLKEAGRR